MRQGQTARLLVELIEGMVMDSVSNPSGLNTLRDQLVINIGTSEKPIPREVFWEDARHHIMKEYFESYGEFVNNTKVTQAIQIITSRRKP